VYHSAGIARTREGYYAGTGNFAILKLDISRGEIVTLLENHHYDYLLPYADQNGNLYCVRRKWIDGTNGQGAGLFTMLKDMLLFPVRLIRTLFNYLNLQALIYSKEPLVTAGTNQVNKVDHKALYILGRLVDLRKKAAKGNDGGLVPKDWELIRIDQSGTIRTIARGVVSFDVARSGDIYYTNGKDIFRVAEDKGCADRIAESQMIETLRVFSTPS
jgi:hypothetical protein